MVAIPPPGPIRSGPLMPGLDKNALIRGDWLSDSHIYAYMKLLKHNFPHVNGLEWSVKINSTHHYIPNPTRDFIRIIHCNNNHWICVVGGLYISNENICIIDSLPRYSINNDLKKILSKIYPNEHPLDN